MRISIIPDQAYKNVLEFSTFIVPIQNH